MRLIYISLILSLFCLGLSPSGVLFKNVETFEDSEPNQLSNDALNDGSGYNPTHSYQQLLYDRAKGLAYIFFLEDNGTSAGDITACEYNMDFKRWTYCVDPVASAKADDDHNYAAPAIDSSGNIHIAYGCHHTQLFYKKSTNPYDLRTWDAEVSTAIPNSEWCTYPQTFIDSSDDVYIFCRSGQDEFKQRYLRGYKYNGSTWTSYLISNWNPALDANMPNARVYLNAVQSGDDVHLVFSIRGGFDAQPIDDFFHMVYTKFDMTNDTWYKGDGTSYAGSAIDYDNADYIDQDNDGTLQSDINIDANGKFYILWMRQTTNTSDSWLNHADLKLTHYNSGWVTSTIYDDDDSEVSRLVIDDENKFTIYSIQNVSGADEIFSLVSSDLTNWTKKQLTFNSSGNQRKPVCVKRPKNDSEHLCVTGDLDTTGILGQKMMYLPS